MRIRFGKRFKLLGGTYMSVSTGIGGKKRRKTKKEEEESDFFWGIIFKIILFCLVVGFFWIPGPFLALYYSKKLEGEERSVKVKRTLIFAGISLSIFLVSTIINYGNK